RVELPQKKSGPGFPRPDPIRRAAYIRPRCHRGFISWRRRRLSNNARGHWIDGGIMNDPLDAGRNEQHSRLRFGCDIVDVIGSGLAHDLDLTLADIERLRAFEASRVVFFGNTLLCGGSVD